MKKTIVAASVLAALAAAYVGAARHIGTVIEQEVAGYEAGLARLKDVRVFRLSYDRRLFDGTLHFDLELRPMAGNPLHELLAEFSGDAQPGIRLQGSTVVRHGPWVGAGDGVALARSEHAVAVPDALREVLPQYPGQRPLLEVVAVLGLDRMLALRLQGLDYRGGLVIAADEPAGELVFAGLSGRVEVGAGAQTLAVELRLDELAANHPGSDGARAALRGIAAAADLRRTPDRLWSGPASLALRELGVAAGKDGLTLAGLELRTDAGVAAGRDGAPRQALKGSGGIASMRFETAGAEAVQVEAGKLAFDMDVLREWPTIWVGKAGTRLDTLEARTRDARLAASALTLSSHATLAGEALDQTLSLATGPVAVDGVGITGGQVEFSIRGLAGAPLDELLAAIEHQTKAGSFVPDAGFDETLRSVGARLLAGKVSAGFDRIALGIEHEADVTARLGLTISGAPGIDFDDPAQLLGLIEADAEFAVRLDALRALTARLVEAEQRADAAQQVAETEARYRQLVATARAMPFFVVSTDEIRSQASWRNGTLTMNGVESGADVAGAMLGALGTLGADDAPDPTLVPNLQATPMFATVRLSSNFAPDPYPIDLTAGGGAILDETLGAGCLGWIDADQPDVALDYQAGDFKLFIYGEADDDISLAIHAPDGKWYCNDDGPGRGLNPTVAFPQPLSGTYGIWVGTIEPDAAQARLMISETDPDGSR